MILHELCSPSQFAFLQLNSNWGRYFLLRITCLLSFSRPIHGTSLKAALFLYWIISQNESTTDLTETAKFLISGVHLLFIRRQWAFNFGNVIVNKLGETEMRDNLVRKFSFWSDYFVIAFQTIKCHALDNKISRSLDLSNQNFLPLR